MIKWTGTETSYKKVLQFCAGVRAYSPTKGMFTFQLKYVLRTCGLKFRVRRKATLASLNAILETGVCIFIYRTSAGTNHVVFIDQRVEGGYRAWNRRKNHPPFISDADMEIILRRSIRTRQLEVFVFPGLKR